MNIGILTSWGESGHGYVSKNFRDAFVKEHDVFLFVGQNWRPPSILLDSKEGIWDVPNLHFAPYPYLHIGDHKDDVGKWIDDNKIDLVFFNECYDWSLIDYCHQKTKIATYVDYFTEEWLPYFNIFDALFICAKHTFKIFEEYSNAHYLNWGVDTSLFKPMDNKDKYTFFHSAGWGGINFRKCTPQVINSFWEVRKQYNATMFLHTQTDSFPEETIKKIQEMEKEGSLKYHFGSVSWPGLYHMGKIHVAPSKLEGLGLYLPEGLSCGLPTITTDVPPMNQFVLDRWNGLLIPTVSSNRRKDYGGSYYFPEYGIDEEQLTEKMIYLLKFPDEVKRMSINAREDMVEEYNFNDFQDTVLRIINNI